MSMKIEPEYKWELRFLNLAKHIAQWSKDPSTQCGAVITDMTGNIVSTGFNGFPRCMSDAEELYLEREVKYDRVVHAEMNAVLNAPKDVRGCNIFVWPLMSCTRCTVHLIQSGIETVVTCRIPDDKVERWGDSINRSKQYYQEAGVSWLEFDLNTNQLHSAYSSEQNAVYNLKE